MFIDGEIFIWQLTSIVNYNHLGNNDGMDLLAPQTFRSKEISKSNVVDDMVVSSQILFEHGEHPDHVVVIRVNSIDLNNHLFLFGAPQCLNLGLIWSSFVWFLLCCSMFHMWLTSRELWMSTPLKYSWVEGIPLWCTTLARIPFWLLPLFLIWFSLLRSVLEFSSRMKERSVFTNSMINSFLVMDSQLSSATCVLLTSSDFVVIWNGNNTRNRFLFVLTNWFRFNWCLISIIIWIINLAHNWSNWNLRW